MLLAIDVGNTQTVIGLYGDGTRSHELTDHWRVATKAERTSDEHALLIQEFLSFSGHEWRSAIAGVAISSGVPMVTYELRRMCERYLHIEPIVLGTGVKTGMPVLYDNPKEVGADRIVNTLAAHHLFGGPSIVVDFGTSTNFDVVSSRGEFLGGSLAPGIEISVDALAMRAAQLRKVELVRPRSVIGKNTVECLQSGVLYGFAGQVDGLVRRIVAEIGPVTAVVATGGLAPIVVEESETITHHDPDLTLVGLRLVYERNV